MWLWIKWTRYKVSWQILQFMIKKEQKYTYISVLQYYLITIITFAFTFLKVSICACPILLVFNTFRQLVTYCLFCWHWRTSSLRNGRYYCSSVNKNASIEEIEAAGLGAYYTDHGVDVYPQSAAGVPFTAAYIACKGDAIANLQEDLAAD